MEFSQEEKSLRKFLYYKRQLYWQVRKLEILGIPQEHTDGMHQSLAFLEQIAIERWTCYSRKIVEEIETGVDKHYKDLEDPKDHIRDHRWTMNIARSPRETMKELLELQGSVQYWYSQLVSSFQDGPVLKSLELMREASMNIAIWYNNQSQANHCPLGKTVDTLLKNSSLFKSGEESS